MHEIIRPSIIWLLLALLTLLLLHQLCAVGISNHLFLKYTMIHTFVHVVYFFLSGMSDSSHTCCILCDQHIHLSIHHLSIYLSSIHPFILPFICLFLPLSLHPFFPSFLNFLPPLIIHPSIHPSIEQIFAKQLLNAKHAALLTCPQFPPPEMSFPPYVLLFSHIS